MHVVALVCLLLAFACGARSDLLGIPQPDAHPVDAARDVAQDAIDDEGQAAEAGAVDAPPDVVVAQFARTRIAASHKAMPTASSRHPVNPESTSEKTGYAMVSTSPRSQCSEHSRAQSSAACTDPETVPA
jgi:hypothetical protein